MTPPASRRGTPPDVLFLCTGNYYRSRFAEELFNARCHDLGQLLVADSAGLASRPEGMGHAEPISPHALVGLRERGVRPRGAERLPRPVRAADILTAACVVAVYEREHRPMVLERFASLDDLVTYWDVPDVDELGSDRGLERLEDEVMGLIERLVVSAAPIPRA